MFSDNMRALTDKLTKKFGDTVTLQEPVQGAYNPDTGRNTNTYTDHVIKAVISSYDSTDIIQGVIEMNDLRVFLYAKDFTPQKEWTVEYQGDKYSTVHVSRLSTQDKNVYYELQVRRI